METERPILHKTIDESLSTVGLEEDLKTIRLI